MAENLANEPVVIRRESPGTYHLSPGSQYELVTFMWAVAHGPCMECGRPAAFHADNAYGAGRHMPCCALCAANYAADGGSISRIDKELDS